MKSKMLLCIVLFMALNVHAQDDVFKKEAKRDKVDLRSASEDIVEDGTFSFNAYLGYSPENFNSNDIYRWKKYSMGLAVMFAFERRVNFGVAAHFVSQTSHELGDVTYDTNNTWHLYKYKYKVTIFSIGAKMEFFWLNRSRFGLYSGLDFEYGSPDISVHYTSGYGPVSKYISDIEAIGGLCLIGFKISPSPTSHWIINGEFNIVGTYNYVIGAGYRL